MKHIKNTLALSLLFAFTPLLVSAQTVTLPVPTHVSPVDNAALSSTNFTSVVWNAVNSGTTALSYYYEAAYASLTNLDGGFTSPLFTSGLLSVPTVSTTGMPDGTYFWHVRSADTSGNKSTWSAPWKVTIDNTAPTAPGTPTVLSSVPPVAAGTSPAPASGITAATVATHATASDCWIIVSGKVYSVASYVNMHPGGKTVITNLCGQDATSGFNTRGGTGSHSNSAKTTLGTYYVGDLTTATVPPVVTTAAPGTQVWTFGSSTDLLSGVALYEYSTDGGLTWTNNGLALSVTTHFDFGARSLTVRAIDRAGNKSITTTGTYTVTSVGITPLPTTPAPTPNPSPTPGTYPTKDAQCKRGGWKTFSSLKFKSERKCTDYARQVAEALKKKAKKEHEEKEKREHEYEGMRASSTKKFENPSQGKSKNTSSSRNERNERD